MSADSNPLHSLDIAAPSLATRPLPKTPVPNPSDPSNVQLARPHTVVDMAKPSLQEQELTMKYAEGDANAAFDLAQLLFSQGRSEPGYVALEYAVRQKNSRAIALYSNLRLEAGALL
jgi:hypothetical protein